MNIWQEIRILIQKDWTIELRNSYAISGILLYVFSSVFLVFMALQIDELSAPVWSILFWLILLFAATNAVSKSFVQENGRLQLYYYSIAHPIAIILSKILYNILLLGLLGTLVYCSLSFLTSNPVEDYQLFVLAIFLGSIGLSIAFTFISAIAAKTSNSGTMMVILSFPVIIPILAILVQLTIGAVGMLKGTSGMDNIWLLIGIDLILLAAAIILFPFLWRD